ncbi:MAG: SH3 domain-containing protein, partial [Phycisphaerae bacterium]
MRLRVLVAAAMTLAGMRVAPASGQGDPIGSAAGPERAATPALSAYDGEVTGDDVYVRSGPGSNYYPTTKLHTGDRVRVVGEQFGWLRITPPPGSFSYVDMALITKGDGREGVVDGDHVSVRAGSSLNNYKRGVQTRLNKGAAVSIIGEAEGFYKILPPPTAHLWMSAQYVRRIDASKPPTAATDAPTPIAAAPTPLKPSDAGAAPTETASPPTLPVRTEADDAADRSETAVAR